METFAQYKYVRISPYKVRLMAKQLKNKSIDQVLELLTFSDKKAARIIKKVLDSAIANAEHNEGADIDELVIKGVIVDEGPKLKRIRARAKGRADRILKPTCHVTVRVTDEKRG